MIPKIIHQTHRDLPEELARNARRLQQKNPDYHYRFWTDEDILDFIRDEFSPEIRDAYLSINPNYGPARADLFRYLCIYTFGGVYLDIKSNTTMPLSRFLLPDDAYVLTQWKRRTFWPWAKPKEGQHPVLAGIEGGEYQQWHVIAAPRHPYLGAVIDRVLRNIRAYDPAVHGVGKHATLNLTGPVAYTLAIHPILDRHPHRFVAKGLVYRAFNHKKVMSRTAPHYSVLREPLVLR